MFQFSFTVFCARIYIERWTESQGQRHNDVVFAVNVQIQ